MKPTLAHIMVSDTVANRVANSRELMLFSLDAVRVQLRADESENASAPNWMHIREVVERQVAESYDGLSITLTMNDQETGEELKETAGEQEASMVVIVVNPGPDLPTVH